MGNEVVPLTTLPKKIGSYQILSKLGQGGMAIVYRALQSSLNREVALKVVSSAFSGDPDFCARFLREARAGALVSHPNVVTCFDAGEADGQLFMAMACSFRTMWPPPFRSPSAVATSHPTAFA